MYHSEGPNAVWHIDGNHKLIKWRLVIHGGIDGYSRTVVFLDCSDNNRATTVLRCFTKAVDNYDLPTKIRTDLGGENIEVWRYLIENHSISTEANHTPNQLFILGSLENDTFPQQPHQVHPISTTTPDASNHV